MKLSNIKPNPNNPRLIKDDKFKKLCQSIKDFPQMMELRPIIIDENNITLGGNMRLKALKELCYKEIPETWVKKASELTEEQKKEFIVKDNVGFGEWDFDELANNWDADELKEWGVDLPVWKTEGNEQKDLSENIKVGYKIEIECSSEFEQEKLYNELIERGIECRLLTL